MPSPFATVEAEAMLLSAEERAVLADHLLASLVTDHEVEEAWAMEVERRIGEVEAGRMALSTAEEAISRARQALR
ncbi:MAG: hypothetical protein E6Q72_08960 [Pseudomonas sp.]|jgi:putative addiction module component (TIGR02574 family)|nr:MAG: hypothetical protein E6Q72_08960 [Pseudomonas sp.]